ncbi:MAG: hypothetical protein IPP77_14110 [Bacteroidetes bacterium]|nr:hypothetical protein [Bacteroidota bacterium]
MKENCFISSYVVIRDQEVWREGNLLYKDKNSAETGFLDQVYEFFEMNYPRFFKMDQLCKTGFLAAEILLKNQDWKAGLAPEELGIFISNADSSLDTDIRYEESIAGTPSPSLFVYTLPNVLIGELCIRHQVKGETACFVFDIFDPLFQSAYVDSLFETGKIKSCISGWANYYNGKAEAYFYLVEKVEHKHSLKHDSATLNKIFKSNE